MSNVINRQIIESLVQGYWYVEPKEDWFTTHISVSSATCLGKQTLFIAMDEATWVKGTSNTGVYAQWKNTHLSVHEYPELYNGLIVQQPLPHLPKNIPQYVIQDSFEFINSYSQYVQKNITSQVISITGTVGKSSTKEYLKMLLEKFGSVYTTYGNHNSRTGVKLTVANSIHNPDYVVLETAMAALWMKSGGISQFSQPNIAVITEIGVGQKGYDEIETAEFKSRIADGLKPDGVIILNRDIQKFDELKKYCLRYSKNILTYGRHPDADVRMLESEKNLKLLINQQHYEFLIPLSDEGTLHNLTAAFTVCSYLKLDLSKVLDIFKDSAPKPSVLQHLDCPGKNILIIDDTYNAEQLSMLNAFKYCEKNFSDRRKVLLVGDIINLEKRSKAVHESLALPILDSGFELIATFGQETQYLIPLIDKSKFIGHFKDADECAREISKKLESNDVLLVKGSRRNSTIHKIPEKIRELILNVNVKPLESNVALHHVFHLNEQDHPILKQKSKYGLAPLLLIYHALMQFELKKIKLTDLYTVTDNVDREGKNQNALGLKKGQEYSFLQLIHQVILIQKPDSILALAEFLCGSTGQALKVVKEIAEKEFKINSSEILNITGRNFKAQEQQKTLKDVFLITKEIMGLSKRSLNILNAQFYLHNSQVYASPNLYKQYSKDIVQIFVGDIARRLYIVIDQSGHEEKIALFEINNQVATHEYMLPYQLQYGNELTFNPKKIKAKTSWVNLLGDTYFGEFYTAQRKRRGVNDALQKFGYHHSFEKIAAFFPKDHINIVNWEASFHENEYSPLRKIKPYILGANAKQSLEELNSRNFKYVLLANNHAKDYGSEGLTYTLKQFAHEKIKYIGAGLNQQEAQNFFEIEYQENTIALFNGYWHRETAYMDFDFYALGNTSGVACLSGLLESIKKYRQQYPERKIIVTAHWGVDFQNIHNAQRQIAEQLILAGCDLIIGHGPHTLQPIEYFNNKPIIYSIGNGVFNSNGEFERYQAVPYGAIVRLDIKNNVCKFYPIRADNKATFWQPKAIGLEDLELVKKSIHNANLKPLQQDDLGYFTEINF